MKKEKIKDKSNEIIHRTFYSKYIKRIFDIFLSIFLIIVLSPFMLIIALLTLIFVGKPVIYKQKRPGENHKIFTILKFHSMNDKKYKNGNLLPDQKRVTKFGKFLRKTSIDELPQLFNILKGDMSFVGPRPRLIKDMLFYDKNVYDHYVVKPGLTGPTQVTGRNKNTWEEVFEKDMEYSKKITFWGDVKLFFKTFSLIFHANGETHSNQDEDKKEQEYYYADYLRRTQKISDEQYIYGIRLSKYIAKNEKVLLLHEELLSKDIFEQYSAQNKLYDLGTKLAKGKVPIFKDLSKHCRRVNKKHAKLKNKLSILNSNETSNQNVSNVLDSDKVHEILNETEIA